jgi:general secretion pathway protein C
VRTRPSIRLLDPIAPWLLAVLVIWLCWQLASIFWLLAAPPQPPLSRSVSLGSGQQSNVPNMTGFSLFKEQRSEMQVAQQSFVASAPMRLEGVFVGRPASRSAAVIRVNNQSRHYRVGQTIEENQVVLVAVNWNQVTFEAAGGMRSVLRFNEDSPSAVGNAPVNTQPTLVQPTPRTEAEQVGAMLDDASRQLTVNPAGYLSKMGLTATGKGYEVSAGVPANVRARLGLRPGDRIVSLNGQTLGQPMSDARLLDQVKQQRRAQIEVQRGDQTMTIQQSF